MPLPPLLNNVHTLGAPRTIANSVSRYTLTHLPSGQEGVFQPLALDGKPLLRLGNVIYGQQGKYPDGRQLPGKGNW